MRSLHDLFAMNGKVVFITGGAGYLGQAMCESLAELGANLCIGSRDGQKCAKFADSLTSKFQTENMGLEVDITQHQNIQDVLKKVIDKFGKIDILINNAWSGRKNTLESISYEDWHYDIQVCINSVFYTVKEALPYLKSSKGVVINTASMYGYVAPDYRIYDGAKYANPPSYGAAKAAVIQFTKYLASFLAPYGIRANSISPGAFPFPHVQAENPEFMKRLSEKAILNRLGEPDDLKGVIALLASDASKYMTGQNICVDGGWGVW